MQREDFFRRELVAELRRVEKYMREEQDIEKKIYLFSAAYGITSRTLRYSFSKDVLLADVVLQTTYRMLLDRYNRIKGGERIIEIKKEHFDKLAEALKELARRFENEESIQKPLEDIISIGFILTGPGNYLAFKGELKP